MKKSFFTGFLIGVAYFILSYILAGIGGCWDLDEGFCDIVVGFFLNPTGLLLLFPYGILPPMMNSNHLLYILPILDGIFLGLIFLIIHKIRNRSK